MPGSGLTPDTAAAVLRRTGAGEAHGSCGRGVGDIGLETGPLAKAVAMGFISPRDRETDEATVARMVAVLAQVAEERGAGDDC